MLVKDREYLYSYCDELDVIFQLLKSNNIIGDSCTFDYLEEKEHTKKDKKKKSTQKKTSISLLCEILRLSDNFRFIAIDLLVHSNVAQQNFKHLCEQFHNVCLL